MRAETEAAVFILLGQSNAVGYATLMSEEDKIKEPLKNVYGLSRALNQSYHNERLDWSGYTSANMNLGETNDDTYSVANYLAKLWQEEIDAGNHLPDLYIVHIAIGAEGVTEKYMWYPDREKKLIPGELGTADISLYPLTTHILSLLQGSFKEMGKTPSVVELHWRGGEQEMCVPADELRGLMDIYDRMFEGFQEALGMETQYTIHYAPISERAVELDPSGEYLKSLHVVNEAFEKQVEKHNNFSLFDSRKAPHYEPNTRTHGLFLGDAVHYNPQTNRWVAEEILKDFKKSLTEEER